MEHSRKPAQEDVCMETWYMIKVTLQIREKAIKFFIYCKYLNNDYLCNHKITQFLSNQ